MDTHPLIKQLLEADVPVKLLLKEFGRGRHPISGSKGMGFARKAVVYVVDGFYKSGSIWLEPKTFFDGETPKKGFIAHARYNETEIIKNLEDIVNMNYSWWLRAAAYTPHRGTMGEAIYHPIWIGLYEKFGLVRKETSTRYVPVRE